MQSLKGESASGHEMPVGRAALIASIGGERGWADWANPDHRLRRLLAEFIGMAGLTFVLSGGAAILARYGGHGLQPWQIVLVLSAVSALWLVVAVYFLGDISAHFNPATTLAFALRRDMGWVMAGAYWVVQFGAAVCGSLLGRAFFGPAGHLAATMPKPGQAWQAAAFEAVITFGLVLMILNMANGPKLNGPFVPLAVGAYIMAWGTMGGPYEGASMNPARSFGPDVAIGNLSTWWVYLVGPAAGAVIAAGVAHVLRGPAKAQEASAAVGTPLDHSACILRAEDECPRPRSSRKTRAQSGKGSWARGFRRACSALSWASLGSRRHGVRPRRCSGLRRRSPTRSASWTPPCGWSWSACTWPRVPGSSWLTSVTLFCRRSFRLPSSRRCSCPQRWPMTLLPPGACW